MTGDDWEANLWTDAARAAFINEAEKAIAVLREHVALVAGASGPSDGGRIAVSSEAVRQAFAALSNAEFDYSAQGSPLGPLESDEELMEDFEEVPLDESAEHNQISILLRRDFAVVSQAAVLEAGRAAYLQAWPDDTPEQAARDVTHLGRALYQVMHAGDLEALSQTEGLQPTAGVVLTVGREQLLSGADFEALVEHPQDLFVVEGEVLHSQTDVW
jgi:hypothetical protein